MLLLQQMACRSPNKRSKRLNKLFSEFDKLEPKNDKRRKRLNGCLPFFSYILRLCMKYMHDKGWTNIRDHPSILVKGKTIYKKKSIRNFILW